MVWLRPITSNAEEWLTQMASKKATPKQLKAYEDTPADRAHHAKGVKEGSAKDKKLDNKGALAKQKKGRK